MIVQNSFNRQGFALFLAPILFTSLLQTSPSNMLNVLTGWRTTGACWVDCVPINIAEVLALSCRCSRGLSLLIESRKAMESIVWFPGLPRDWLWITVAMRSHVLLCLRIFSYWMSLLLCGRLDRLLLVEGGGISQSESCFQCGLRWSTMVNLFTTWGFRWALLQVVL